MSVSSDHVLYKPHFTDIFSPSSSGSYNTAMGVVPAVALGSLTIGAGGRLLKNLLALLQRRPEQGAVSLPKAKPNLTEVPVEVSPEEAEELHRRGVAVRRKLAAAQQSVPVVQGGPSPLGALAIGALGTTGLIGGWNLADSAIDYFRRRSAEAEKKRLRERIQALLDDKPDDVDAQVYGSMKAAEDVHFSQPVTKTAASMGDILTTLSWLLPSAVGGGVAFNALAGYQDAQRGSPSLAKSKRVKDYLRMRPAKTPLLTMVPFVRERAAEPVLDKEKENDEIVEVAKLDETPVRAVATEVTRPSGSPAQQAQKNTAPNWF